MMKKHDMKTLKNETLRPVIFDRLEENEFEQMNKKRKIKKYIFN